MKQLQWDKLDAGTVANTVWALASEDASEFSKNLKLRGVFDQLEDDFRAKQTVTMTVKKEKKTLTSVLSNQDRQRIEIWLRKGSATEEINVRITSIMFMIIRCDSNMPEDFLGELENILPTADQEGQLNSYRQTPLTELAHLEPADRFLVESLKVYRVRDRVSGLRYRAKFEEGIVKLEETAVQIHKAAKSLLNAPRFLDLLKLILDLGNFMNAAGRKGGAFGFKVTSINKLVDSKSSKSNDRTLLHFAAKVVSQEMPEVEGFIDELETAAEASRADLGNVRLNLGELRTSQKTLEAILSAHFANVDEELDPNDGFPGRMFPFSKKARERLAALSDQVTMAAAAYSDALKFYGEDAKDIATTQDFFAVFRTFVTSWKKARKDNDSAAAFALKAAQVAARREEAAAAAAAASNGHETLVDEAIRQLNLFEPNRGSRRDRAKHAAAALAAASATSQAASIRDVSIAAQTMWEELNPTGSPSPTLPAAAVVPRRRREGRRGVSESNGLASVEEDPDPLSSSVLAIDEAGEEEEGDI